MGICEAVWRQVTSLSMLKVDGIYRDKIYACHTIDWQDPKWHIWVQAGLLEQKL